jgi:hypothetical protein
MVPARLHGGTKKVDKSRGRVEEGVAFTTVFLSYTLSDTRKYPKAEQS